MENLSTMEEPAPHLTNTVAPFLEVSRLNRGEITLTREEVDLAAIAQQVVTHHSSLSSAHTISCIIEPGEHAYLVMGVSARLHQIIANLVENAIKYSPLDGPVTVSLYPASKKEGSE